MKKEDDWKNLNLKGTLCMHFLLFFGVVLPGLLAYALGLIFSFYFEIQKETLDHPLIASSVAIFSVLPFIMIGWSLCASLLHMFGLISEEEVSKLKIIHNWRINKNLEVPASFKKPNSSSGQPG